MENMCEICHKNKFTQLCDYDFGSGIITSIDFQELTNTCDKRLCKECATTIWHNCDVCPEHAKQLQINLIIGGK